MAFHLLTSLCIDKNLKASVKYITPCTPETAAIFSDALQTAEQH